MVGVEGLPVIAWVTTERANVGALGDRLYGLES
jgi:hypothetical protein